MAYRALKPCKFQGKQYRIGDPIKESCVLPSAVQRLILSGHIAVAEGPTPASATINNEEEPTDEEFDELVKQLEDEEISEEEPQEEKKVYSENALTRMNRADLVKVAEDLGVDVEEDDTKAQIAALIISAQGE